MLIVKAFHIIAMVAWFAGIFYLPRLFVYHANTTMLDVISHQRFKTMERRLYYGIMWPAAIMTTGFGVGLVCYNWSYYLHANWLHVKLGLVMLLFGYHLYCGYCLKQFKYDNNHKTAFFFRIFNEIPVLFLVGIVILVVVKPF